jgi:hypothetical protein
MLPFHRSSWLPSGECVLRRHTPVLPTGTFRTGSPCACLVDFSISLFTLQETASKIGARYAASRPVITGWDWSAFVFRIAIDASGARPLEVVLAIFRITTVGGWAAAETPICNKINKKITKLRSRALPTTRRTFMNPLSAVKFTAPADLVSLPCAMQGTARGDSHEPAEANETAPSATHSQENSRNGHEPENCPNITDHHFQCQEVCYRVAIVSANDMNSGRRRLLKGTPFVLVY